MMFNGRDQVVRLLMVPVLTVFACAAFASAAEAGSTYRVAECAPGHPDAPDAVAAGSTDAYVATNDCSGAGLLEIRPSQTQAAIAPGLSRQWHYQAPTGTQIAGVQIGFGLIAGADDHVVSLVAKKADGSPQFAITHFSGESSLSGIYDSALGLPGPLQRIGAGIGCRNGSDGCGYAPGTQARLEEAYFTMEDTSRPAAPELRGDAVSGGWIGGTTTLSVIERDVGAGVSRSIIEVDGEEIAAPTSCAPEVDAEGYVGSMSPCPTNVAHVETIDTTTPAFHEGPGNDLRVCTEEYGTDPAQRCTAEALKVDNVAPAPPEDLAVAGGTAWRRDNDFDVSWTNPDQIHAPIAGAEVHITGPGGYEHTEAYPGANRTSIKNLEVPTVGDFTADVYLVDAAGNKSLANAESIPLRFDDTVPAGVEPNRANGWISRSDLAAGYHLRWARPLDALVPPSGIAGYRLLVDTKTSTNPCAGGIDPRSCPGPLTHPGIDNTSQILGSDDLVDGANFAHSVAISGSGMRATDIGHTRLNVDLVDPVTTLEGAHEGWINHDAHLRAVATDSRSGMVDNPEYPDDALPRTVLEVDGELHEEPDAGVEATVEGEGRHRLRFWARDLAGNENDGVGENSPPGTAIVRIDETSPQIAFSATQDPADPDALRAPVEDGLSGLAGGAISYRVEGSEWRELFTEVKDGALEARVDSERMEPGARYEFRASVFDRAGNETVTTNRVDGSKMSVVGPFRTATRAPTLRINGKARAKISHGKGASLTGRLLSTEGAPVGNADVELVERFAAGSQRKVRKRTVTTAEDGRFRAALARGPSRTVLARFDGDLVHLSSQVTKAKLAVRSGISLRAKRTVRAGRRVTFRGRVKAPGAKPGRKRVEIQVRVGKRWKAVGRSLRTKQDGAYRLRYRFVADYRRPVRYTFRAVVLPERAFPYLPSKSKRRRVIVRP